MTKKKKAAAHARRATPARAAAPAAPRKVQMLLNGEAVGEIDPGTRTIGDVANEIARNRGVKSYSILVNGTKVLVEGAGKPLTGATSIEVFAKETRGL